MSEFFGKLGAMVSKRKAQIEKESSPPAREFIDQAIEPQRDICAREAC